MMHKMIDNRIYRQPPACLGTHGYPWIPFFLQCLFITCPFSDTFWALFKTFVDVGVILSNMLGMIAIHGLSDLKPKNHQTHHSPVSRKSSPNQSHFYQSNQSHFYHIISMINDQHVGESVNRKFSPASWIQISRALHRWVWPTRASPWSLPQRVLASPRGPPFFCSASGVAGGTAVPMGPLGVELLKGKGSLKESLGCNLCWLMMIWEKSYPILWWSWWENPIV